MFQAGISGSEISNTSSIKNIQKKRKAQPTAQELIKGIFKRKYHRFKSCNYIS